jgi:hypothetical protein
VAALAAVGALWQLTTDDRRPTMVLSPSPIVYRLSSIVGGI